MPDFFISDAREDEQFVDRLRAALTARERDVWVDRPPQLGAGIEPGDLSCVMMRPADPFDAGIDALIRALDTDIEVVREHTRLLIRARAWELGNRRLGPLLRGFELRAAEDWLSRAATAGVRRPSRSGSSSSPRGARDRPVDLRAGQSFVWATTSDDTGHVYELFTNREFDLTGI